MTGLIIYVVFYGVYSVYETICVLSVLSNG
jgi:hypothetical protein